MEYEEQENIKERVVHDWYNDHICITRFNVPQARKFDKMYDADGNCLGVFLGRVRVLVNYSGYGKETADVKGSEAEILEEMVNKTFFGTPFFEQGELRLLLEEKYSHVSDMWLQEENTYMVFGVAKPVEVAGEIS